MSDRRTLQLTLGPVQGFVAQARRTRDLWAGSFLLSWLSAQAMKAVVAGGHGQIAFPVVAEDPLFQAVLGQPLPDQPAPVIGTLPNRFKATITNPAFEADTVCRAAIQAAWQGLADHVWQQFVEPCAEVGFETRAIWERQVRGFWDVAWVIGPANGPDGVPDGGPDDGAWLDQRKNWRSHWPAGPEGGDHCLLMGEWQELSGHVRARGRAAQDAFWARLRDRVGRDLELHRSERLCAIALIKRLFPLLSDDALRATIGWVPDQIRSWPSTASMAALPWMLRAWDAAPEACRNLVAVAQESPGLVRRAARLAGTERMDNFARIEGGLLFEDYLTSEFRLRPGADPETLRAETHQRRQLAAALGTLQQAVKNATSDRPALRRRQPPTQAQPFYAVVLMDGDHVGRLLRNLGTTGVSEGLKRFNGALAPIVERHHGLTLYAGGDDYLGLFPLTTALTAAAALARCYRAAFSDASATTSAAVVFAHYHVPLSAVLRTAHECLDGTAKDANGRDSIAVTVVKGSGPALTWVSAWRKDDAIDMAQQVVDLALGFAGDDEQASGFFYALEARLGCLWSKGHPALPDDDLQRLILAERLKGKMLVGRSDATARAAARAAAQQEVVNLLTIIEPPFGPKAAPDRPRRVVLDGALLVKFLAENGIAWGAGNRGEAGR